MTLLTKLEKRSQDLRDVLQNYETNDFTVKGKWRKKIISISDLHVPYQRTDLIERIIDKHAGADVLIVNGDLFDAESISSFYRHKEVPLIHEYLIAQDLLRCFADNFGKVILVDGNHDTGRYKRAIERVPQAMRFFFRESLMQHLAKGERFNRKGQQLEPEVLSNVHYAADATKGSSGWWHKEDNVIFAHRLRGNRKIPMSNATHMTDWFRNRGTEFECFVGGHTHQGGSIVWNQKLVIDEGCLCLPLNYEADGSCNYRPPVLGYAEVQTDRDGKVDRKNSHFHFLGTYRMP